MTKPAVNTPTPADRSPRRLRDAIDAYWVRRVRGTGNAADYPGGSRASQRISRPTREQQQRHAYELAELQFRMFAEAAKAERALHRVEKWSTYSGFLIPAAAGLVGIGGSVDVLIRSPLIGGCVIAGSGMATGTTAALLHRSHVGATWRTLWARREPPEAAAALSVHGGRSTHVV